MAELDTTLMDELSFLFPSHTGDELPIANDSGERSLNDFGVLLDELPSGPWGEDSIEFNNGNLVSPETEMFVDPSFNIEVDDDPQTHESRPTYENQEKPDDEPVALQEVSWETIMEANAAYDHSPPLFQSTSTFQGVEELLLPPRNYFPEPPTELTSRDFELLDQIHDQPCPFEDLPLIQTPENRAHFGSGFRSLPYNVPLDSSFTTAQCFNSLYSQTDLPHTPHQHEAPVNATVTSQLPEETTPMFGNVFEKSIGTRLPTSIEKQRATTAQAQESITDGDHPEGLKVRKRRWTRRTIRQVETGNNAFGRKGTLRCDACRNRNSKCIFLHKWLPCEFCRLRQIPTPCIKKWGKRTEAKLGLSWPVPVPDDAQMNSAESLLFQFALSEETRHLHRNQRIVVLLLRKFVAGYGGAIPSSSLRYAVFTWAAKQLPSAQFESQMEDNKLLSYRALIKRKTEVDDADLFATFILAHVADDGDERLVHLNGLKSILASLTSKTQKEGTSLPTFLCFRPFFEDELIMSAPVLLGPSFSSTYMLKDRLACYYELAAVRSSGPSSVDRETWPSVDYRENSSYSRIADCMVLWLEIWVPDFITLKLPGSAGAWCVHLSNESPAETKDLVRAALMMNQIWRRSLTKLKPKILGNSGLYEISESLVEVKENNSGVPIAWYTINLGDMAV